MARSRALSEMVDEAYRLTDTEGEEDRHPRPEVIRWVNKGLLELYDLLVEARGRDYYRASASITLVAGTVDYPLPSDFYKLVSLRNETGGALQPYDPAQDAELRDGSIQYSASPRYYQLRGANVTMLPTPGSGTVVVDYVPAFADLTTETATFDGVSGWEDYASLWAAKRIATKNEDYELVGVLSQEMAALGERIAKLAPKRDAGAPRRVRDVRSQTAHTNTRWWR